MGRGKTIRCRQCGKEKEHAAAGLCFTCYRAFERVIAANQEARSERAHDKLTQNFRKAQDKMVKGIYDLRHILGVFKEYGAASEFLEEDSKVIPTLTDLLVPLMDKASQTVKSHKMPTDPTHGPLHVQTVMGNNYIQEPFAGKLSQPEKEDKKERKR